MIGLQPMKVFSISEDAQPSRSEFFQRNAAEFHSISFGPGWASIRRQSSWLRQGFLGNGRWEVLAASPSFHSRLVWVRWREYRGLFLPTVVSTRFYPSCCLFRSSIFIFDTSPSSLLLWDRPSRDQVICSDPFCFQSRSDHGSALSHFPFVFGVYVYSN